jgi:hypothetical protein
LPFGVKAKIQAQKTFAEKPQKGLKTAKIGQKSPRDLGWMMG